MKNRFLNQNVLLTRPCSSSLLLHSVHHLMGEKVPAQLPPRHYRVVILAIIYISRTLCTACLRCCAAIFATTNSPPCLSNYSACKRIILDRINNHSERHFNINSNNKAPAKSSLPPKIPFHKCVLLSTEWQR